jgi:hypothetical protein
MFGSETLDVAIGLVLIFLLVSLLLTAVIEIIESILKSRAADLERAIGLMLKDPAGTEGAALKAFYEHPLVFALFDGDYKPGGKSLFFGRAKGGNLPSYIPRDLFSAVAVDLQKTGVGGEGLSKVLESYRRLYGDDAARLKANLESWYDGVMDRAAGWYKRRTQKLLFWLGLALAVALNINPVAIAQHLSATPAARQAMIELAEQTVAASDTVKPAKDQLSNLQTAVGQVGLPMGWNDFAIRRSFPAGQPAGELAWAAAILTALFGWVVTAIAATLGSPFWFDLLNKLMVIRSTVKPKEKSRDEASEDRSDKQTRPAPAQGQQPVA